MEPIEQPDHLAITERIQRIRNYLKSTLVVGKEESSALYREKNEIALRQGQQVAISEHDARWKHSNDSAVQRNNWHVFGQFGDHDYPNN